MIHACMRRPWTLIRMPIVSVGGNQHLSEVVFSVLVGFSVAVIMSSLLWSRFPFDDLLRGRRGPYREGKEPGSLPKVWVQCEALSWRQNLSHNGMCRKSVDVHHFRNFSDTTVTHHHSVHFGNDLVISACSRPAGYAPCEFVLFPKLNRPMKGGRFATIEEIKTASLEELKTIPKSA